MTIIAFLQLLARGGPLVTRTGPGEHGGISAPGLAVTVAVIVLAIGIVVTDSHEIILEAMRSGWETLTGGA